MPGTIDSLYRYPVKGLTPERLDRVTLEAGQAFPADRRFALAKPFGAYDADDFVPLSKREYYVLMNTDRLAGLVTTFDAETCTMRVAVQGHPVLEADLGTAEGRAEFVELYARVVDLPDGERPVLAEQPGYNFTDQANNGLRMMNTISLVNRASIRDFEARIGRELDPLRFRANAYLEGLEPWVEREWIGRELQLGGPAGVTVRVVDESERCAATEVDPTTARRDVPVVRLLHENYGHEIMGVFAEVLSAGTLAVGDTVIEAEVTAA
ncbi:MOSC domain-containing protein [Agreia sp.]|uniref:MOSC domain-containing protein n=1 Tax=Agreia sp. TaxID=1872416 RepID=UPI0035BC3811